MLEEKRRKVEEAQRREAMEQQMKEEQRYRELEELQRQKEEALRRKKQQEEEERAKQMKVLGKNKSRPKLSFALGLKWQMTCLVIWITVMILLITKEGNWFFILLDTSFMLLHFLCNLKYLLSIFPWSYALFATDVI